MYKWDICLVSTRSDAETAGMLAESIRGYSMPSGITLPETGAGYRNILLDTQETAFDEQVRERLSDSRFLVFICSPDSKNSPALKQRLDAFIGTHGRDKMIAVIVRGEPDDSFPENFRERKIVKHILPDQRVIERVETIEPVAADLRADTEKRKKQLLRYETVRIIATVMSLHPDDLEQRQQARRKKTRGRILSVAGAVVAAISVVFIGLGLTAQREGKIAEEQTKLSVETARRTMEELPRLFEDEPAAQEYVEDAIKNARKALAELGMEDLLDSAESGE